MDIAKIAAKLSPMLRYGDKPAIAKKSGVGIRQIYNLFEGHSERVNRDKAIKALRVAIKYLQEKEQMTDELTKQLKAL